MIYVNNAEYDGLILKNQLNKRRFSLFFACGKHTQE